MKSVYFSNLSSTMKSDLNRNKICYRYLADNIIKHMVFFKSFPTKSLFNNFQINFYITLACQRSCTYA